MAFLVWILIGGGAYLLWCAVTNKSPIQLAQSVLTGK